jgi:hypothetical protein
VKKRTLAPLLVALLAVATVSVVLAQSGGGYDASYNALDSGGQTLGGGGYVLQTGLGQPVAGSVGGGQYSLSIGVLAGGEGAAAASASPSPGASPSPHPSVGPFKRFGGQLADDGTN